MNKSKRVLGIAVFVIFFGLVVNMPAYAGVYSDDLTKCIIETSTTQDRIEFVKWMFASMAKHPAVQSMSSVSEEQTEDANKKIAELFMKLLTVTCKEKAQKAIKYEGQIAIQTSFQVLGQVAAQEIFTDPNVASSLSGLEKYIDLELLKTTLEQKE